MKQIKSFKNRFQQYKISFCVLAMVALWHPNLFAKSPVDTLKLSYPSFYKLVLDRSPQAELTELPAKLAQAELLKALGAFDPKINTEFNQKDFSNSLYYRYFESEINYMTPFGVGLVAGYENTDGQKINPEYYTDDYGLWKLGVEINLLQNLLTDENRVKLNQAKIMVEMAENERKLLINSLVYKSSNLFADYLKNYHILQILKENLTLSKQYKDIVIQSFINGEKTLMDTIEAYSTYKLNFISLKEKEADFQKNFHLVNAIIGNSNTSEFILPESDFEDIINHIDSLSFQKTNKDSLPFLFSYQFKYELLKTESFLYKQKYLPKLKLKYYPLIKTSTNSLDPIFSANNYKTGVEFSMPILLREERGKVLENSIKMEQNQLEALNKKNELFNKIDALIKEREILSSQLTTIQELKQNYFRLYEGEKEKFVAGESSVFLLTKRQEKLLEIQIKEIELKYKIVSSLLQSNYLFSALN